MFVAYTFREEIPGTGRGPYEEERDRTHGSRSGEALDEWGRSGYLVVVTVR